MLRGMQSVSETGNGVKGRRQVGRAGPPRTHILEGRARVPTCLNIMFQPLVAHCFDRGPIGKCWLWELAQFDR